MNSTYTLKSEISGEGNPLVLVPGGLTGWKSWEPFTGYFTAQRRKVVRVQLMNVEYGIDNRPLPDGYSVGTESNALRAALDSLLLKDPVDIIAWSFGAFISLDFALNNPKRIRTLTLIEPPAIWLLKDQDQKSDLVRFFNSLNGEITDDMLSKFLAKVGFVKEGESPRNLPQWQQWHPYKYSLRNSPAVVNHTDKINHLKNLKAPVLLVKGTGSASFLHSIIDELSSYLSDARVIEMPGGHAPHIVSRDIFLEEWKMFQKNPKAELSSVK
jgi:pimeloyl-ACP methyl ester carboxylesterase